MTDKHVILAGQSNMLVYNNSGPAPYAPTERVQIWTLQDDGVSWAWNYMLPGHNTGGPNTKDVWGPEVQLASRWLADNPTGHLWIVKVAKGSTPLAAGDGVDWSPSSDNEEYDIATTMINAARHNLDGGAFAFGSWDVLGWMQGETDSTDAVRAAAYAANVRGFIAASRADWGYYDMVVARTGQGPALPYSLDVRNAQFNLGAGDDPVPGVVTFKTVDFPRQADGIHLNDVGAYMVGNGLYEGWML